MSRLSELVSTGEVDPSKAFVEQPGGPTQKTIAQLVDIDGSEVSFPCLFSPLFSLHSYAHRINFEGFFGVAPRLVAFEGN